MIMPKFNPTVASTVKTTSLKNLFDSALYVPCISNVRMNSKLTLQNFYATVEELQSLQSDDKLCIVSSWTWWDVINNATPEKKLVLTYLTSDFVIKDFQQEASFAGCIKSSELIKFEDDYIFNTHERTFILVGKGQKKTISLETYNAITAL
jgi:hypothetical protein